LLNLYVYATHRLKKYILSFHKTAKTLYVRNILYFQEGYIANICIYALIHNTGQNKIWCVIIAYIQCLTIRSPKLRLLTNILFHLGVHPLSAVRWSRIFNLTTLDAIHTSQETPSLALCVSMIAFRYSLPVLKIYSIRAL